MGSRGDENAGQGIGFAEANDLFHDAIAAIGGEDFVEAVEHHQGRAGFQAIVHPAIFNAVAHGFAQIADVVHQ